MMHAKDKAWMLLFAAWLVAAAATAGSLFFSEVMQYVPCTLCWYQRILMYPLAIVLIVGLFPFDRRVVRYALPLAAFGWGVASYHNLLLYKVLPESAAPCRAGVSCTTDYINWFGFVTIPLLSWVAFSLILILLFLVQRIGKLSDEK